MDTAAIDQDIEALNAHKTKWTQVPIAQRIEYLDAIMKGSLAVGERQVKAACQAKQVPFGSGAGAEDYFAGPVVQVRTIRLLKQTLESIARTGKVALPKNAISTREDGTVVAQVFPTDTIDTLLLAGFKAEIWMESDVTEANLEQHRERCTGGSR